MEHVPIYFLVWLIKVLCYCYNFESSEIVVTGEGGEGHKSVDENKYPVITAMVY